MPQVSPVLILVAIVALYLISSIKILAEYQRGVIFRLGKLLPQPKGPGVILVFAPIDRIVRVSLRTVAFEVPPQDVITRDNVSVKVSAVLYYRVVDPRRAIVEVENYQYATLQLAQTTLQKRPGPGAARRPAGRAGSPESAAAAHPRRARRAVGDQGVGRRSQACRSAGQHAAIDGPASRSRTGETGENHSRRRRAGRVGQTGAGRWRHRVAALEHHVALPADAHRNCSGKELDDYLSAADRAAGAAEGLGVESSRGQISRVHGQVCLANIPRAATDTLALQGLGGGGVGLHRRGRPDCVRHNASLRLDRWSRNR